MVNPTFHYSASIPPNEMALEPRGRWLEGAHHCFSPFQQARPANSQINLLVIHNISLPADVFGAPYINQLFLGCLQKDFVSLEPLKALKVSAHLLIRRDGSVVQYVPFDRMAWHAGVSNFEGRERCNDFSIGIELEGTDHAPYTDSQYQIVGKVSQALSRHYPAINERRIVGHSDIAPDRKTDPGPAFDWKRFRLLLKTGSSERSE